MEFLLQLIVELFGETEIVQEENVLPADSLQSLQKGVVGVEFNSGTIADEQQSDNVFGENIIFNLMHFH